MKRGWTLFSCLVLSRLVGHIPFNSTCIGCLNGTLTAPMPMLVLVLVEILVKLGIVDC